jgi:hypothetical protein
MKAKLLALVAGLLISAAAYAGTAFFQYEVATGGMTKQCVYDYLGSTYTITVSSIALCPLTIQVR